MTSIISSCWCPFCISKVRSFMCATHHTQDDGVATHDERKVSESNDALGNPYRQLSLKILGTFLRTVTWCNMKYKLSFDYFFKKECSSIHINPTLTKCKLTYLAVSIALMSHEFPQGYCSNTMDTKENLVIKMYFNYPNAFFTKLFSSHGPLLQSFQFTGSLSFKPIPSM